MGNECNPSKPHYDITMSRRTRKPLNTKEAIQNPTAKKEGIDPVKGAIIDHQEAESNDVLDKNGYQEEEEEEDNDLKISLKQLITKSTNGKEETRVIKTASDHHEDESKGSGRNSLGQHFTEEEKQQLQLVRKPKQEGMEGVKLKGMVRRYVKVLSHLIKVKRDPRNIGSRKKPILPVGDVTKAIFSGRD